MTAGRQGREKPCGEGRGDEGRGDAVKGGETATTRPDGEGIEV